jgi:acyl carrier protein
MSVEERVKKIIMRQLKVRGDEVTDKAHFVQDLGAESIDSIELIVAFEAEFDIEIPPEEGERIQTVGEAVKYIENKLKEMQKK